MILAQLHSLQSASAKAWQTASCAKEGAFYYARGVLVGRGLVERKGEGRGANSA
jgi:hypothetical protein